MNRPLHQYEIDELQKKINESQDFVNKLTAFITEAKLQIKQGVWTSTKEVK